VVFTFKELQPSQLFKNTTPAGGDMGAHVYLPAYVKSSLLSHLRLTGWSPGWYEGFPALTYYFPGPIVGIALLSYVVHYNVAFKLISVLGLLTLPVAAWAFGRLRGCLPRPACLAAATLPYLFSREFTIYGGNIASTMAGEFASRLPYRLLWSSSAWSPGGSRTGATGRCSCGSGRVWRQSHTPVVLCPRRRGRPDAHAF